MSRTAVVALLTGRPLSWWHESQPSTEEPLHGVVCVVHLPRELLDERIAERTRQMIEDGLVDEVTRLVSAGFVRDHPGMTSTGYKDILAYLDSETDLGEATERIRVATRQYARRQDTWFRNQVPSDAVRIDGTSSLEVQTEGVVNAWRDAA